MTSLNSEMDASPMTDCCQKCFRCGADITGTLLCSTCNDEMKARLARATTNVANLPTGAPINYDCDEGIVLLESEKILESDLMPNGGIY